MDVLVADKTLDGAAVLSLRGQLDIDTAPQLQAALDRALERFGPRVIVHLAGLTFCDSIGLSSFVVAHNRCTEAGGFLRLVAPRPFLLHILSVVGVAAMLPIFETIEAARTGDPAQALVPPACEPY